MKKKSLIAFGLVLMVSYIFYACQNKSGRTVDKALQERLFLIAEEYKDYDLFVGVHPEYVESDTNAYGLWTVPGCVAEWTNEIFDTAAYAYDLRISNDSLQDSRADNFKPESPHGDKIYKLYVKDMQAYRNFRMKDQPEGQVLVKETWEVEEVEISKDGSVPQGAKLSQNDNKWYVTTTVSDLFVMYKDSSVSENDKGWLYGVVSKKNADKRKIKKAGLMDDCMECHQKAKRDRMFGLSDAK